MLTFMPEECYRSDIISQYTFANNECKSLSKCPACEILSDNYQDSVTWIKHEIWIRKIDPFDV